MANFRLVFPDWKDRPIRSIAFTAADAGEALLIAQRHDAPAELWREDERICTIDTMAGKGSMWVIGPGGARRAPRTESLALSE